MDLGQIIAVVAANKNILSYVTALAIVLRIRTISKTWRLQKSLLIRWNIGVYRLRCFASLLILFVSPNFHRIAAQESSIYRISGEPDLSQNSIKCLLQDRQGFIWVGTEDGLNRYDGYGFVHFKNRQGDPKSISSNIINALFEDRQGYIWIATNNGLNRFNPKTENFQRFVHDPTQANTLGANNVYSVFEDKTGNIWVGASSVLYKMDRVSGSCEPFAPPNNTATFAENKAIKAIVEYGGDLIVGTWGNGIWRFQPKTKSFLHVPQDSKLVWGGEWVENIWIDASGNLLTVINGFAFQYEPSLRSFHLLEKDLGKSGDDHTMDFVPTSDGNLLVGTASHGIKLCGPGFSEPRRYLLVDPDISNINNNAITRILAGKSGEFWLGTRGNGLFKFDPYQNKFQPNVKRNETGVPPEIKNIMGIATCADGEIWVASRTQGITIYDPRKQAYSRIEQKAGIPAALKSNNISCLFEDSRGRMWVGIWGEGVAMFDKHSGIFRHFKSKAGDPTALSDNFVNAICESKDRKIWIGSHLGISVIGMDETDKAVFKNYYPKNAQQNELSHSQVNTILCDHAGQIWVGTGDGGLNLFRPAEDGFQHFLNDPKDPNSLGSNRVIALFEDSKQQLWVGTWGGGLNRYVRDKQQFIHYTESDGLANDAVTGITEDKPGFLWVTTNRGLSKFDPLKNIFINYYQQDGLIGDQFNARTIVLDGSTGRILTGGKKGLVVFHPDSIHVDKYVPPVLISSLKKFVTYGGNSYTVPVQGINTLDHLELPFSENTLTFEFTVLNYRWSRKNQYAFKLEGASKEWTYLGTERTITFSNLHPGRYTLRLKGANNDGIWNEQGTSLEIVIHPPWYRSWWAYSVYFLIVGSLGYYFWRKEIREQQLRHRLELEHVEAEKLKEIDQLKSRFFANISHEFRTPLTLILGQIESTLKHIHEEALQSKLGMAFRNGKRLLQLINQLMDLSKLEAGNMELHARNQDLVAFLKNLCFSFESMAEQRNILLVFQCAETSIRMPFDEDKLEKVFFNLLSNAIKFTPQGGVITIIIERNPGAGPVLPFVHITIRDTGIGIAAERLPFVFDRFFQVDSSRSRERAGTGIGLALVKELVELHGGQVTVSSQEGVGTDFVVRLPIKDRQAEEGITDTSPKPEMPEYAKMAVETELWRGPQKPTPKNTGKEIAQVLIVEDNPDIRQYLSEHLEEAGYHVRQAVDGAEGLSAAREHLPDLIISDIMMPRMDGFEFSRQIRSDTLTSHIPLIILTSRATEEDKIEGLETGVDDYLIKPFSPRELLVRVSNLIRQRQRLRERFRTATIIKPSEVSAVSVDHLFLEKVIQTIEAHMEDADFGLDQLSAAVNMSATHLNRKLNALVGQSAGTLIRSLRLQRAADLLAKHTGSIKEIAFEVGFNVPENFSRSFKQQFGCTPGEYQKKMANVQK